MTLPKAVYYLGGSYPEIELIQALKRCGLSIVLVDQQRDAPGRVFADEFVNLSMMDASAILAAVSPLQSRYAFVGAYGVVDYAYNTIKELVVSSAINTNWPGIYREFTDKIKAKARFEKSGILTPATIIKGRECSDATLQVIAQSQAKTVIIKASDSCNSEGVQIVSVQDPVAIRKALYQAITLSGEFICEKFVEGSLHNLDIIIQNGVVAIVAITDRYRLKDNIIGVAGLQGNVTQHSHYLGFVKLANELGEMMSDYTGPLTADVLRTEREMYVLEISPHFHASKLQGMRDPELLEMWPGTLVGKRLDEMCVDERGGASAYIRIYDDKAGGQQYFDPSWIMGIQEFSVPRKMSQHLLNKILWLKSDSLCDLREAVGDFMDGC